LWIFDETEWLEKKIWKEINKATKTNLFTDKFYDIRDVIDGHPYILSGEIDNGSLYIQGSGNYRHSSLSPDVKKLSKQLKMPVKVAYTYGRYNDKDAELELELKDSIKDATFYHGTCIKYLRPISRLGIKPMDGKTNFDNIFHKNKIFLTVNEEKALFHANTAAIKSNSYPIILECKIPDESKLIIDYDVGLDFYGSDYEVNQKLGYSGILNRYKEKNIIDDSEKINLSKKLGIFGYSGRVPANHITGVLIDFDTFEQYYYMFSEHYHTGEIIDYDSYIWNDIAEVDDWVRIRPKELLKDIDDLEQELIDEYEEDDY
jgi:hypothetical protein